MKSKHLLILAIVCLLFGNQSFGQSQKFKMEGTADAKVDIGETFTSSTEIFPFNDKGVKVYGLAVSGQVHLQNEESLVRILLVDKNYKEYLVFETYALLASSETVSLEEMCEETAMLNGVKMHSVKLEITGASVNLNSFTFSTKTAPGLNVAKIQKEKKLVQNQEKIKKINENLKRKGKHWVAGVTSVSELSYEEKKALFGDSHFPPGFEYYAGGVISAGMPLKSVTSSMMTSAWDWRNRHGQNWVTPVVDQGSCGSCWAFSTTGALEAVANLFYNQPLHLDLSEQDVLSCSGAGSCSGGNPGRALDYIASAGVVDEGAFPYANSDAACSEKSTSPAERIKSGGRIDFGSEFYPETEDDLKRMIIENGPLSGGLFDWNHTMVLVGYKVVQEGDQFFYRDLNLSGYWKTVEAGDPLIGKTVWIFKNSYGKYFGDWGYIYVETPLSNMGWTHAIQTPLVSEGTDYEVICEDKDGDGYYWWGLGEKPETCDCPDIADGDDSNPALGPLDEYGNCIPLTAPPVAAFTAGNTVLSEGESVAFTDLSANNPESWQWTFEGGNPSVSTEKNPVVEYAEAGVYSVRLVAANEGGEDTLEVNGFITVEEYIPIYCTPLAVNSASGYIENVYIENVLDVSSGGSGYALNETPVAVTAGERYNVELTPGDRNVRNFWKIWIDWNGDGAFDDKNEAVVSIKNRRGVARRNMAVPKDVDGEFRMRISMRANREPLPCDDEFTGEVEDYTVVVEPAAPRHKSAFVSGPEPDFFSGVTIYPNPVADRLNIQLENPGAGDSWAVYSITGEKMRAGEFTSSRSEVDFAGVSAGVYVVVVDSGGISLKEKIVKR